MEKILLFLKGILMWACDVIPGVSGGTIAFITGIYDELIDALHALNFKSLKLLFTGKFKVFRKEIHGNFLIILFGGIIGAILTLAKIVDFALTEYPVLVRAFFFWLIIASVFLLKNTVKNWKKTSLLFLIVWLLVWYIITALPIVQTGLWNGIMFVSWLIAIIAMVLPGISGSYILVVLWQYQHILWNLIDAIKWDWWAMISIGIFMLGAIVWLISFSKILHYIKNRRHDQMMLVLIGLMVGSLNKVWPRKETLETFVDRHGDLQPLVQKNILPTQWENILLAIGLAWLGIAVVFGVHWFAKKLSK